MRISSRKKTAARPGPSGWKPSGYLTNRAPQIERIKLKVKKFVYYKIIITSGSTFGDVTVLGIDQKVRYTGNVK